ncbi:DUF6309 family protein [Nocardiopsis sp. NPDC006139]|uniref:DUF6309 family protein n=1 Tax=Nocardiopsis sp. NPDC006139 TaxID=3154578 RepID=UPI0033ACD5A4
MERLGEVRFDEVLAAYRGDHPRDRPHEANSNGDGEENLERAERMLGTWSRVRLTAREALGVVLPWHLAEGGARELVPRTGLTVARAAEVLRRGGPELARANPVCAAKLDLLARAPFTPVYLSTRPVDHDDYADLRVRGGLVHLDGLHRMLAWELAGRLGPGTRLTAFVAGLPGTAPPRPRPGTPTAERRT